MSQAVQVQGLSVGAVIAGTYEVTRLLGRGGMGSVWEARHVRLPGKRVAIKVLHADVASDPEALARFRREAEIATRLGHPNIVEVHDFNTLPGGEPYLVLELLEGEPLDERLRRGPIAPDHAIRIAGQVAAALAAAHREQVIHRDLKPHNVFLVPRDEEDGGELVKVLDFGISKIRGSQTVKTQDSTILGTPQYMAPEQATGAHSTVDARTDVFALGAMVYEMLAGRPAFTGQNIPEVVFKVVYEQPTPLAQLVPGLPARVIAAVDRALAKKQDDRFQDVASFVEALAGVSLSTLRRGAVMPVTLPAAPAPAAASSGGAAAGAAAADALAATVDSGQRARVSIAPPEGRTEREAQVARASAATAAGGASAATGAMAVDGVSATVASGAMAKEIAAPPAGSAADALGARRRGRGWLIAAVGVVVLGVATAGGVMLGGGGARDGEAGGATVAAGEAASAAAGEALAAAASAPAAGPEIAAGADTAAGPEIAAGADTAATTEAETATASETAAATAAAAAAETETATKTAAAAAGASAGKLAAAGAKSTGKDQTTGAGPASATGQARQNATARGEQPEAAEVEEPPLPPAVKEDLRAAAAALDGGDLSRALFLAKRAMDAGAGPRGAAIRAKAYCRLEDVGNAKASLHQIPPRSPLRRNVRRYCAAHRFPLAP